MANEMIAPERQATWIVATFIVALLAFAMSVMALWRNHAALVGTQVEVLALHKSIKRLEARVGGGSGGAAEERQADRKASDD